MALLADSSHARRNRCVVRVEAPDGAAAPHPPGGSAGRLADSSGCPPGASRGSRGRKDRDGPHGDSHLAGTCPSSPPVTVPCPSSCTRL